jgi:hypothetical protein
MDLMMEFTLYSFMEHTQTEFLIWGRKNSSKYQTQSELRGIMKQLSDVIVKGPIRFDYC